MTTIHRRELLLGTCALGASASMPWASGCEDDARASEVLRGPLWASAQGAEVGSYSLVVAGPDRVHARIASEVRGHGMAVDPARPERVVMFGRRPERSGIIGDIRTGEVVAEFEAAVGHHHCGHGAFSADGSLLFVVEVKGAGETGYSIQRYYRDMVALQADLVRDSHLQQPVLLPVSKIATIGDRRISMHLT